jgi:hypothetical protein
MSQIAASYTVASSDIVSEDFDGEFVVLDLSCGKYYSMDAAASALWRVISAGASMEALAAAVAGPPGAAGSSVTAEAIRELAERLVAYGCLAPSGSAGSTEIDPAAIEVLRTSSAPPTIQMFDDLADLIMADPIHDVEETAGWPVRKPIAAE